MIDSDPAWSPDGRTIAFARRNVDGIPPQQDIWLVDTSGENETQLTSAQEHERFYQPRFDPRGGRLSATHVVTGSVSVAFIDLVSGQAETFIGTNRMEDDATWHPSGSRLAYVVHDASGSHIEHRRVDGSSKVTSNLARATIIGRPWNGARHMTSPAWSPDGREIAGTCAVGDMLTPCRMSLDGKHVTFVSPYSPGIDVSWVP